MKPEAEIHDGILALMDKNLIPSTSTEESKVLYYKMKGDYYRYLAECATGDAKGKTAEGACVAYAEATKTSEKDFGCDPSCPFGDGTEYPCHGAETDPH